MTPDKIELVHDGSVRMTVPCTQHRPDLASSALEWIGAKPEAGRGSKKLGTKHPHEVTSGLFVIVQDSFERSRKETSSLSSVSAGSPSHLSGRLSRLYRLVSDLPRPKGP